MDAEDLPPGLIFVRAIFENKKDVILIRKKSKLLVLKRLRKIEEEIQKSQINEIAKLLSDKPSPFVIQLQDILNLKVGISFLENIIYITMEYLEGPSIRELIVKNHHISEEAAVFYSACIFTALRHIHSLNIVHRDVVSMNVVTDCSGYAKLIDFESSKMHENIYPHFFIDYTGLGDVTRDMLIGEAIQYQHLSINKEKLSKVAYSFLTLLNVIEKCYLSWNWATCQTDVSNHQFYKKIMWTDLEDKKIEPPSIQRICSKKNLKSKHKL